MSLHAEYNTVVFPYGPALELARNLWSLASDISTKFQPARCAAAKTATQSWLGTYRTDFDQHMVQSNADAANCCVQLQNAARGLAQQWADANCEEQRRKQAQALVQEASTWDTSWDAPPDLGGPPDPPAVPRPPLFEPTSVPQAWVAVNTALPPDPYSAT